MGCINSKEAKKTYCPCSYTKKNKVSPLPQVEVVVEVVEDLPERGNQSSSCSGQVTAAPAVIVVAPAIPSKVFDSTLTMVKPATPTQVVRSTTPVPGVKPSSPAKVVQSDPRMLHVLKTVSTPVGYSTSHSSLVKPNTMPTSVAASHLRKGDQASRSLYRATMARDLSQALMGLQLDWASIRVPGVQAETPRVPGKTMQLLTKEQLQCLGLPNMGQSCYLNATVQCMLKMEAFCRELLQQQHIWRNNPAASLLKCFVDVRVARYAHQPSHKRAVLKALLASVAEEADEFRDDGQKDAHEFFSVTVAQMAALAPFLEGGALGGGAYTCPVYTNLHFQMLSTRTCRQCGLQSSRQESYTNISLAMVAGSSVEACLQQHLQETELEFSCSCGGLTSGVKVSFLTLPRVLVFHLNRFCQGWQLEKWEEPILLSRELLLRSGPSSDEALHSMASQEQSQDDTGNTQLTSPGALVHVRTEEGSDRDGSCPMGSRYSLASVLSHLGSSTTSGHYICDCQYSEGDPKDRTDRWLSYNDDIVTETTGELVCQRRQKSAYLLFYERQQ